MKALSLISIRGDAPNERLVIRFRRRRNPPQCCMLSRPCFCLLSGPQAKQISPVHAIWPAVAARVKTGELLFPGYYGASVNTAIKAVSTKLATPYSTRYTSHGFRMGSAQELKEKGSQWPVVAGVGEWRSLAFRGYVDTALDVERDMSRLLIGPDAISGEEEDVLAPGNGVPTRGASRWALVPRLLSLSAYSAADRYGFYDVIFSGGEIENGELTHP